MPNVIPFVIDGVSVVDVVSGQVLSDAAILIENGRILDVGYFDTHNFDCVIDAHGTWAIPSYIDMHAHVTFEGREHSQVQFSYDEDERDAYGRGTQNLMEALLSGICVIRDVGAKSNRTQHFKESLEQGKIIGPELITCGQPLCIESGHGSQFGKFIGDTHIQQFMSEHLQSGCTWLKVMNDPEVFEQHLLDEIVNAAHQNGLRVAAHVFTKRGIKSAVLAGVDTIEHAVVFNDRLAEVAISKGTHFVPTYYCAWSSLNKQFLATVTDAQYIRYLVEWYEFLEAYLPYHLSLGLPVSVGTDAGSSPSTFTDVVNEVLMLHYKGGMSTIDSLRSASIVPARFLGCNDLNGSIEIGKWGNIILVGGNPLKDINFLNDVKAIWYRGASILNKMEQKPWN